MVFNSCSGINLFLLFQYTCFHFCLVITIRGKTTTGGDASTVEAELTSGITSVFGQLVSYSESIPVEPFTAITAMPSMRPSHMPTYPRTPTPSAGRPTSGAEAAKMTEKAGVNSGASHTQATTIAFLWIIVLGGSALCVLFHRRQSRKEENVTYGRVSDQSVSGADILR